MDKKKVQGRNNNLQNSVSEYDENVVNDTINMVAAVDEANAETLNSQVSVFNFYDKYFKITLSNGEVVKYGENFALSQGESFKVEVDFSGLMNDLGSIDVCNICIWGKSRLLHADYSIYTLKTNELVGSYSATHNLYYVDLLNLYNTYQDASFKFVADWSGTESLSLDEIDFGEKKFMGIAIVNPPKKIEYQAGELFNNDGLVVKGFYTNGEEVDIDYYTINPSVGLQRKDRNITISYNGHSLKQPIKVTSQKISFRKTIQTRSRSKEGTAWSKWEVVPTNEANFYVSAYPLRQTRTVLTIDKSQIKLAAGERVGLRLQMQTTNSPKPSEPTKHIKVNGIRVSKYPLYTFINAYISKKNEKVNRIEVG